MGAFDTWTPPTCCLGGCGRRAMRHREVCFTHWMACDQDLRDAAMDAWLAHDCRESRRVERLAVADLKERMADGAADDLRLRRG